MKMNIYKIAKIFSKSFEEPKNEKKQIENFWEDCNETNTNTFSSNIKSNSFDNNNIFKLNKKNINIFTYQNNSKNLTKRVKNHRKLSIDSYSFKNKHLITMKESGKKNSKLTFHLKTKKYNINSKNCNNNKTFNNNTKFTYNNCSNYYNNINNNSYYNNNNNNNTYKNNNKNIKTKSIKILTDIKKIFDTKKSPSKINDLFLYRYKKDRNSNNINKIQIINSNDDTFEYIANQINNLSQNYKNSININENNLKKFQIKNYVYKKPKILFNINNISIKNSKKIINNNIFDIE